MRYINKKNHFFSNNIFLRFYILLYIFIKYLYLDSYSFFNPKYISLNINNIKYIYVILNINSKLLIKKFILNRTILIKIIMIDLCRLQFKLIMLIKLNIFGLIKYTKYM